MNLNTHTHTHTHTHESFISTLENCHAGFFLNFLIYLTHNSRVPLYKKNLIPAAEYEHVVSSQKVKCDL